MKKLQNTLFFLWIFLISATAWADPPCNCSKKSTEGFLAQVIRVTDGDTLVVRTEDAEDIKIRLYGIDAPERDQEGGGAATEILRALQGKKIIIREMDTDRYSRTVALIEYKGLCINLELVKQGQAWYYAQYCKEQPICGEIKAAETEASAAGRGLWGGKPVAPWEWRRRNK
jgi:endonuclease YncB( thermonuclease family)